MKSARNELFSGSALALNKNGCGCWRDLVDHGENAENRRAFSDDFHSLAVLVDEGLESLVLFLEHALLLHDTLMRLTKFRGFFVNRKLELLVEVLGFVVKAAIGHGDRDLGHDDFKSDD